MNHILRAAGFAMTLCQAKPGDGASGAGPVPPVKLDNAKAIEILAGLGIVLKPGSGPQFNVKRSDPKVLDKGKQKGWTFQRLCDVVLTLKSGLPYTGCGLAAMRSPKGETDLVFMWPSTGSGVFSRGVVDTRGNGTRENPQYPTEAAQVEAIGHYFADLGRAYLIAEAKEGRGVAGLSKGAVREGAVRASADDIAAIFGE